MIRGSKVTCRTGSGFTGSAPFTLSPLLFPPHPTSVTMSKFYEFKQQAEGAISECVRSIDEIRQSNGGSEIPTSTFVDLAKRHIGPISGSDNMLDITIPEGKADWRKSAIELVLRRMVLSVVVNAQDNTRRYRFDQHLIACFLSPHTYIHTPIA